VRVKFFVDFRPFFQYNVKERLYIHPIKYKGGRIIMTRETETAFKILYCEYKRRRSFGTSKAEAVRFDSAKLQKIDAYSDWNAEDLRNEVHPFPKSSPLILKIRFSKSISTVFNSCGARILSIL